jgi:hypothetical protein
MIVPVEEPFGDAATAAVEAALGALLADRSALLESFVGMANYVDAAGNRCFVMFSPDEQLHSTTSGMARFLAQWNDEITRLNIHGMLTGVLDDDDED